MPSTPTASEKETKGPPPSPSSKKVTSPGRHPTRRARGGSGARREAPTAAAEGDRAAPRPERPRVSRATTAVSSGARQGAPLTTTRCAAAPSRNGSPGAAPPAPGRRKAPSTATALVPPAAEAEKTTTAGPSEEGEGAPPRAPGLREFLSREEREESLPRAPAGAEAREGLARPGLHLEGHHGPAPHPPGGVDHGGREPPEPQEGVEAADLDRAAGLEAEALGGAQCDVPGVRGGSEGRAVRLEGARGGATGGSIKVRRFPTGWEASK